MREPMFLYIEDHPASRRMMELLLTDLLGYQDLTVFDSSQDLIQKMENLSKKFDVIFLDLRLKPHDGYAVITLLRNHKVFQTMRVVAVTASTDHAEIEKMKATGFSALIGKPLSYET